MTVVWPEEELMRMPDCPKCGVGWHENVIWCKWGRCPLQVHVGDIVRAASYSIVHGLVVGESYNGKCWEIKTSKGVRHFNKCYCIKLKRSQTSITARKLVWDGTSDI